MELSDVTFQYPGQQKPSIINLSCEFREKECVLIAGPSGSGKTTLARILGGFIPKLIPGRFSGIYRIENKSSKELSVAEISLCIGLVQQDPEGQFVTMFGGDEVAFGPENLLLPREIVQKRVETSLRKVGALDLIQRELFALSGGEQQKIAMASIFAMNPKMLLLDEPSAYLDRPSLKRLIESLIRLKNEKKSSFIIIDHQVWDFLPIIDRLFVLNQGSKFLDIPVSEVRDHLHNLANLGVARKKDPQDRYSIALPPSDNFPLLEAKNLSVHYNEVKALDSISFQCRSGEILGIMGPNGSGKTTLLLAVLGLRPLTTGSILLNGHPAPKSVAERAHQVGIVFQNPNHQLFERTVLDELLLAPRNFKMDIETASERAEQLLNAAQLAQYQNLPPFGLSHGEKKRLTLIASEVYNPSLLLLDEPFSGQDARNVEYMLAMIKQASEIGRGVVIVSHKPEYLFECCNQIIFLRNGQKKIDAPTYYAIKQLRDIAPDFLSNAQAEGVH
ncbi:MAG: ABC transporter ATP-binding protein [Candidatus Thorarchaeota archaeon]